MIIEDTDGAPAAIIIARDEGLRMSLQYMLEACGLSATSTGDLYSIFVPLGLPQRILFVDCELVGKPGSGFLERLRRSRWPGKLVLMAEEETGWPLPDKERDQYSVLVKPFSSEEVKDVIRGSSADQCL